MPIYGAKSLENFTGVRLKPDGTFMTDTTRITDEFGVTGKTPNGNEWLKRVSRTF